MAGGGRADSVLGTAASSGVGRSCSPPRALSAMSDAASAFPALLLFSPPQDEPEIQLFYVNSSNLTFKPKKSVYGGTRACLQAGRGCQPPVCCLQLKFCLWDLQPHSEATEDQSQWHYWPVLLMWVVHTCWSSWHYYLRKESCCFLF